MWLKVLPILCVLSVVCAVDLQNVFIANIAKRSLRTHKELNHNCTRQIWKYIHTLIEMKKDGQWALKMFDASSKIPSGILQGNLADMGSFDECLAVEHPITTPKENYTMKGKYCLLSIPLSVLGIGNMEKHFERSSLLSNMSSLVPESRVIMYVTTGPVLSLAICVPAGCDEEYFNTILGYDSKQPSIGVSSCQTREQAEDVTLNAGDWGYVGFLILIGVLMLISTLYDIFLNHYYDQPRKPAYLIFLAFSVYTNGRKLVTVSHNPHQLHCMNGIRFLSMMWVLLGHAYYMMFFSPIVNTMDSLDWMKKLMSMTIIGATVSVDTFFMLGGCVMVYVFMMHYEKGTQKFSIFNIIMYYIHRYLRLTPALAAAMAAHITILRFFGSGPYWPIVIKSLEVNCSKWWWTVLLYVQNYVNPAEQCMGQTWYLSVDMQLFVISPLILWPLAKWPKWTLGVIYVALVMSVVSPFLVAYHYYLEGLIPLAVANPNYMNEYYMSTYVRFGPWVVGIILGYFLHTRKSNIRLNELLENKWFNLCGWILSIAVLLAVVYGPNTMFYHEYDRVEASIFQAMHRVAWGIALAWICYVCIQGHGGIVNWFLSLPVFQILAKFTYSMYLIHLSLMFMKIGQQRVPKYFSDYNVFYEFWGDFWFTLGLSFIWTLAFESPMIVVEKVLFGKETQRKIGRMFTKLNCRNKFLPFN